MNNDLISIIVVSFNSSNTIEETLDSIYNQSYAPLELIITDDSSNDDTCEKVINWLKYKRGRFENVKIIRSISNTGVSGNCNRGLKESKGIWIKFIAADDLLMTTAIQDYIDYIQQNPKSKIIFGDMIEFEDSFSGKAFGKRIKCHYNSFHGVNVSARKQYQYLIDFYNLPAPSAFINREALLHLNGFDENFQMIEDAPLWMKFAKNNIIIDCLRKETVLYRIHKNSITQSKATDQILSKDLYERIENYISSQKMPLMTISWKLIALINFCIQKILINYFNHKKSLIGRFIFFLWKVTNPSVLGNQYLKLKDFLKRISHFK